MSSWSDIPGITESAGRPRLPHRPEDVVRTLHHAVRGARAGGVRIADLVDRVQGETGTLRARVEGLAGWLPLSRVASWSPSGLLELDDATDLADLALRFAAWVEAQPIDDHASAARREYAKSIVELAVRATQRGTLPPPTPAQEPNDVTRPPLVPAPSFRSLVDEAPGEPLLPKALIERIHALLAQLDESFLERRQHVRTALLSLLAGQHVLLLGPPGTAKSMLARALCAAFTDATYFEYLLSRFTHPDELFGPVSIPGLKDEDYRRLTLGFLPQAHIAFLDEIFKANSAILNSLLTLVNERIFHHGRHRDPVPLIGLIGASNELPDPDGGLDALYDRFLVRLAVPPVAQPESFLAIATGGVPGVEVPDALRLTAAHRAAIDAAAAEVEVPEAVRSVLLALWRAGQELEWGVSDRRWRQAISLLRVAAATAGRRRLAPLDLLLLEPMLAPEPDRLAEVRDLILQHLAPGAVPKHDLRAQWTLIPSGRVAPTAEHPASQLVPLSMWTERLELIQLNVARFLSHHGDAVSALADDRARLEAQAEAHPWLHRLPVELLSAHIEAARELAVILEVAEGYRRLLGSPASLVRTLLLGLPDRSHRKYGHDTVCALHVPDSDVLVGITLAGERVEYVADPHHSQASLAGGPVLTLTPERFLDWVDDRVPTGDLLQHAPSWATRNAQTALEAVRRLLPPRGMPRLPGLPSP